MLTPRIVPCQPQSLHPSSAPHSDSDAVVSMSIDPSTPNTNAAGHKANGISNHNDTVAASATASAADGSISAPSAPSAVAVAPSVVVASAAVAPPVDDAPRFHTPSDSTPTGSAQSDTSPPLAVNWDANSPPPVIATAATSSSVGASAGGRNPAPATTVPAGGTKPAPAAAAAPSPAAPSRAELDRAIEVLSEGARFLRYPTTNPSDAVAIQLWAAPIASAASASSSAAPPPTVAADGTQQQQQQPLALWWCDAFDPSRPKAAGECIPFSALRDLFKGAMSDPLRAAIAAHSRENAGSDSAASVSGVRDEVCFVLQSRSHVLSLQAESRTVRDEWIRMICTVLEAALHKQRVVRTGFATAASDAIPPPASPPRMVRRPSSMQGRALLSSPSHGTAKLASSTPSTQPPSPSLEALATEKAQLIHCVQLTLLQMIKEAEILLLKDSSSSPSAKEFDLVIKHRSDSFHLIPPSLLLKDQESFEAKSYAPTIFARLRRLYGIKPESFLASVAHPTKGYNDLIVNSHSGSFFFYTHDNTFLLKCCTDRENKLLCTNMLRGYYEHHVSQPNTMLSQILGAFRLVIQRPHKARVHFFLMRNVFASPVERPIHVRFDLKGSSYGRRAKPSELQQPVPVLKDQDFFDGVVFPDGRKLGPTYLHLGNKRERFLAQLTKDAEYLRANEVMDYSLLVGIHYTHREEGREDTPPAPGAAAGTTAGADAAPAAAAMDGVMPPRSDASAPSSSSSDVPQRDDGGSASAPAVIVGAASSGSGDSSSSAIPPAVLAPSASLRFSSEGVTPQTNYGHKPQKEVLIPRNLLRKASLALMDDQQRAAIKAAAQIKPAEPNSPASAPAVPAVAALPHAASSSSSSSSSPARGSLRAPTPSVISPRGDLFESDGTIVSQADSSGAKDGDEIYYLGQRQQQHKRNVPAKEGAVREAAALSFAVVLT